MAGLADVTLGDIRSGALRYRPVALTVLAIFVIVQLTPGEEVAPLRRLARPGGSAVEAAPASNEVVPEDAGAGLAFTPAPSFGAGGGFIVVEDETPPGAFDVDFGGSGGDSSPFEGGAFGGSFSTTTSAPRPLSIVGWAWATSSAGTPLGGQGVPAGTLPVGKRLGQDDKRSFVRLAGDKVALFLREDPAGTRMAVGGSPGVRACLITAADWQEGEGKPFPGPAFDAARCAVGLRSDDGTWNFDLSSFAAPTDPRGFALVPSTDAPLDFQVAFSPVAAGD